MVWKFLRWIHLYHYDEDAQIHLAFVSPVLTWNDSSDQSDVLNFLKPNIKSK